MEEFFVFRILKFLARVMRVCVLAQARVRSFSQFRKLFTLVSAKHLSTSVHAQDFFFRAKGAMQ